MRRSAPLAASRSYAYLETAEFTGFANRPWEPIPLEYPTTGSGDYRIPALTVEFADGRFLAVLVDDSAQRRELIETALTACSMGCVGHNQFMVYADGIDVAYGFGDVELLKRLIALATDYPEGERLAKKLGANHTINYKTTPNWADAIRRAFDASLKKLKLDHVDLYLVHWPAPRMNLPATMLTVIKILISTLPAEEMKINPVQKTTRISFT